MQTLRPTPVTDLFLVLAILLASPSAFAQVDLTGKWGPLFHEDNTERLDGPNIGDYSGMPINEAARFMADAWNADILSVPEHQCKPHPADYGSRGPADMRIWEEVDTASQQVIALHTHLWLQAQERTIWMDERPHPDEFAQHTWQGFSTGAWEGPVLEVVTTHLKKGWLRRNGLPRSDQAELTEYFYRHGEFLTWTAIINDPLYLTEPMIRTSDFKTAPTQELEAYPCLVVAEVDKPHGWVPHWLPGENPFLEEFAGKQAVPVESMRGGPETMLPEYRKKLLRQDSPATGSGAKAPGGRSGPAAAPAPAATAVDLTGYWVSLVNEDWRWRMKAPDRGDVAGIPANKAAIDAANAWDPARDEREGNPCKSYGGAAIMRVPERVHITWENENVLKLETDAGMQTRLFRFGAAAEGPTIERTRQGFSVAEWDQPDSGGGPSPGGTLKVVTTKLEPGYLRKNGVPYGEKATVTEYFNRTPETYGMTYMIVTTVVEDPDYLFGPFVTSSHFKKLPDTANGWDPAPCSVR